MSPTLIVILIIVVWLIVLAPLLLRGQRPIHKAGEAFDDTRVLHEGGSDLPAKRRHPKLSAADARGGAGGADGADDADYELVEAEAADRDVEDDLLIEEPTEAVVDGEVIADTTGSSAASALIDVAEPRTDAETSEKSPAPAAGSTKAEPGDHTSAAPTPEQPEPAAAGSSVAARAGGDVPEIDTSPEADAARGGTYPIDDSYAGPADLLHPEARTDAAHLQPHRGAIEPVADVEGEEDLAGVEDLGEHLSEEDVEFARRRSGRGGWDPDREEQRRGDLYARRQRTLLGLGIGFAVTLLFALIFGGWVWVAPALALGLAALYLAALRTQVRQERELRSRRIRHLRRARLGVRQAGEPSRHYHPGGTVLDLEDDSPDFEHLELIEASWPVDSDQPDQTPPAGRSYRRVG